MNENETTLQYLDEEQLQSITGGNGDSCKACNQLIGNIVSEQQKALKHNEKLNAAARINDIFAASHQQGRIDAHLATADVHTSSLEEHMKKNHSSESSSSNSK